MAIRSFDGVSLTVSVTISPVEATSDDSDSVEVSKSNAIIIDVEILATDVLAPSALVTSVATASSVEVSGRVVRLGSVDVVESMSQNNRTCNRSGSSASF